MIVLSTPQHVSEVEGLVQQAVGTTKNLSSACLEYDFEDADKEGGVLIKLLVGELQRVDMNAPQKLWLVGGPELWERQPDVKAAVRSSMSVWQTAISTTMRVHYDNPDLIKLQSMR